MLPWASSCRSRWASACCFCTFYTAHANQATAILFGNVLGVDLRTVWALVGLSVVSLAALALISRPLLFATLAPEIADARGVSLRRVAMLFLAIVAIAVAEAAQVVGVLLVFALMVAPAATALRADRAPGVGRGACRAARPRRNLGRHCLAYGTDWPTSFWIVAVSCGAYFLSLLRRPRHAPSAAVAH